MNRSTPPFISYEGGHYEMDWEVSHGFFMRGCLQVEDPETCLHSPPILLLQDGDELMDSITVHSVWWTTGLLVQSS